MKGLSSFLLETFLGLVGLIVILFIVHAVLYPTKQTTSIEPRTETQEKKVVIPPSQQQGILFYDDFSTEGKWKTLFGGEWKIDNGSYSSK